MNDISGMVVAVASGEWMVKIWMGKRGAGEKRNSERGGGNCAAAVVVVGKAGVVRMEHRARPSGAPSSIVHGARSTEHRPWRIEEMYGRVIKCTAWMFEGCREVVK